MVENNLLTRTLDHIIETYKLKDNKLDKDRVTKSAYDFVNTVCRGEQKYIKYYLYAITLHENKKRAGDSI